MPKLKSKLKQNEFYCVSCRKRKGCKPADIRVKKLKGRIPALKSKCGKCGTNLTKFIKHADYGKLSKKYNKRK